MKLNRRHFFKILGGAGTMVAASTVHAQPTISQPEEPPVACLVDISRCVGCRKCELACNAANKLPHQDFRDLTVLDTQRRPSQGQFTVINKQHDTTINETGHKKHIFVKEQCRHCLRPSCASACVVGALSKRENGPVVYDKSKCIGCRYCMVACPFQIPAYEDHDPVTPRVRKCTFCSERIDAGKMPACATICPTQAILFGKRDALLTIAKDRMAQKPGKYVPHVYGEHEVGGTSWLYLSPVDFSFFPTLSDNPPPKLTELILSSVFGYAAAPIALFAVLGGIAWINNRKDIMELDDTSHEQKGGNS
jgi:formate dehydrogenase iron-sulfur subunit